LISALHEDRQGRLWLGTRRGLGRVEAESGKVSWFGEQEGLPSTNIGGIAGDADGRLWLSHNRGLTRIDPETGQMIHFGEREGAQGKGYAEGAWAAGASRLMYFAGEGVTAFDPRQVQGSTHHPRLVFTALEVLHRAVAPKWLDPGSPLERTIDSQGEVTLGPDATVFSVEMAPLHYVDPPSNRLMYRLEGFDPEWIEAGAHNRVATYTNLTPGHYVLRAKAGTKNGLWSERETTLAIRILPPWWRTRSALAAWPALGLMAAGLFWTGVRRRARVRQARRERETLRRESLTDPLTGLHNRRFLLTYLHHEVPKVLREYRARGPAAVEWSGDLLLLVVDVDHFKTINDRYSHGVGDRVLCRIATLEEHVRDSDLAVRWGGDEFLVVTRSFQRSRAFAYAERLRAAVAAVGQAHAAEGGPAYTLSIGFAAFPFVPGEPDALTWEQTLELADYALSPTKRRKRNSYTGLRAGAGLSAAAVLAFLSAGREAPLPAGLEIVLPDERDGGESSG
jgi:diguanylate cyclase (GGDEF)-like protein